ncbi:hypothetical protein LOK49_LG15G02400 [Camellia lanceoleosa]|uniref:Uncharacterized protein n=1 Tax=Camellia lanceoleosa TaxID=1840588 RepID=A0ACC0F759_9ERIC|nr:hypothetical protein LOK49_LG15G02400 [Camellia lanceoleosa]
MMDNEGHDYTQSGYNLSVGGVLTNLQQRIISHRRENLKARARQDEEEEEEKGGRDRRSSDATRFNSKFLWSSSTDCSSNSDCIQHHFHTIIVTDGNIARLNKPEKWHFPYPCRLEEIDQ